MRELHCVSRAVPTLPINIEDAARSEIEIEKANQVHWLEICSCVVLFICPGRILV